MQIALGNKGDYAVRAMIEVARWYGNGRRKSRQVATAMDIPERYLPQILALLVREGLLNATAGPDGGYELARPPEEITLLAVIEAAEGPIAADQCFLRGGPCEWEDTCPAHRPWARAQEALAQQLGRTTFKELAAEDTRIQAGKVVIREPLHQVPVQRRGKRDAL